MVLRVAPRTGISALSGLEYQLSQLSLSCWTSSCTTESLGFSGELEVTAGDWESPPRSMAVVAGALVKVLVGRRQILLGVRFFGGKNCLDGSVGWGTPRARSNHFGFPTIECFPYSKNRSQRQKSIDGRTCSEAGRSEEGRF